MMGSCQASLHSEGTVFSSQTFKWAFIFIGHLSGLIQGSVYPLCISTVEILGGIKALFMVDLLVKIRAFGPDLQLA